MDSLSREQYESILDVFRPRIVREIIGTAVLDFLVSDGVINTDQEQRIKAQATDHDYNRKMLEYIRVGGARSFGLFVSALHQSEHSFIAEELEKAANDMVSAVATRVEKEDEQSEWTLRQQQQRSRGGNTDVSNVLSLGDDTANRAFLGNKAYIGARAGGDNLYRAGGDNSHAHYNLRSRDLNSQVNGDARVKGESSNSGKKEGDHTITMRCADSNTREPDMYEVRDELVPLLLEANQGTQWKSLGRYLELDDGMLELIHKRSKGNVRTLLDQVLEVWMEVKGSAATVQSLDGALRDMNLIRTADTLMAKLLQKSASSVEVSY